MPRPKDKTGLRMAKPSGFKERLVSVFLLGVLLFTPPLLAVASANGSVGGFPILFLWLFGAWGLIILILALMVEGKDRHGGGP